MVTWIRSIWTTNNTWIFGRFQSQDSGQSSTRADLTTNSINKWGRKSGNTCFFAQGFRATSTSIVVEHPQIFILDDFTVILTIPFTFEDYISAYLQISWKPWNILSNSVASRISVKPWNKHETSTVIQWNPRQIAVAFEAMSRKRRRLAGKIRF